MNVHFSENTLARDTIDIMSQLQVSCSSAMLLIACTDFLCRILNGASCGHSLPEILKREGIRHPKLRGKEERSWLKIGYKGKLERML